MRNALTVTLFVATLMLLFGCSVPRSGEQAGSRFPVQIVPTHPASVTAARVVQEGNSVVVSGTVGNPHKFHLPGNVQILACGKDATLLAQAQPRITGYASMRGGAKEARFSAQLQFVPPPDAFFRLRYDAPGGAEEPLSCR